MRRVRGRHAKAKPGFKLHVAWALAMVCVGALMLAFLPASKYLASGSQARGAAEYEYVASQVDSQRFEEAVAANVAGDYQGALALTQIAGTQAIARLRVPTISVDLPVYPTSSDRDLQRGAGFLPQTAAPVGGEGTHSAITAHSGMPTARMFDKLPKLKDGDLIMVDILGQTLTYKVTGKQVDTPDNGFEHLGAVAGQDLLTLITCTPYGINTHRLLVTAERVEDPEVAEAPEPVAPSTQGVQVPWLVWLGLAGAAVAVPSALIIRRRHP